MLQVSKIKPCLSALVDSISAKRTVDWEAAALAYPPNSLNVISTTKHIAGAATARIPATTAVTLIADIIFVSLSADD